MSHGKDNPKANAQINALGKVAVLMGGSSAEREISLKSGNAVLTALKAQGVDAHAFDPQHQSLDALTQYDRAFINLHGRFGEDGCIQGALEMMHIPYTGSGVMASAIAMDKWRTKLLWRANNISTPAFALVEETSDFAKIEAELGLPLFVKPANEGSSIGITKVKSAGQLASAFAVAAKADPLVIAEQSVNAGEYTVGIIGNKKSGYQTLPIVRILPKREFYDFEAKYLRDDTEYFCPSGLTAAKEKVIQAEALAAFKAVGCHGWGRVDFLMDEDGQHYFIEVNTSPGMTDHSLVPMAAKAAGISFNTLVLMLLELADVA